MVDKIICVAIFIVGLVGIIGIGIVMNKYLDKPENRANVKLSRLLYSILGVILGIYPILITVLGWYILRADWPSNLGLLLLFFSFAVLVCTVIALMLSVTVQRKELFIFFLIPIFALLVTCATIYKVYNTGAA